MNLSYDGASDGNIEDEGAVDVSDDEKHPKVIGNEAEC